MGWRELLDLSLEDFQNLWRACGIRKSVVYGNDEDNEKVGFGNMTRSKKKELQKKNDEFVEDLFAGRVNGWTVIR